jgi:hypothetical protein
MRWSECLVNTAVMKSTYKIWSETLKGNLNLRSLIILHVFLKINMRSSWVSAGSGEGSLAAKKQRGQIKAVAFRKHTLFHGHSISGQRHCTGLYRKVLCGDSVRRRSWRMSTKGGGLTVTRRGALGHGINTFASPHALMSPRVRAYLALLNHHSLRATQTYVNFISWNSTTVASKEIKVFRVLD